MFEQQQEDNVECYFNPTLHRISAVRPHSANFLNFDDSIQSQEQKSHEIFIEIAKDRRILNKLNTLDHSFAFIKNTFSDILQKSAFIQKGMILFIQNQDQITEKINAMQNCLISKGKDIKPLMDANLTLKNEIDDIKRLYNEIQCTNNIEKEVTNAKITDNEHLKRNLASIKVKLANIISPHQKSTNKLHIIQNKYSQITYKNDELRLYVLDIIHDISKIHNKLSFKREELKNLQNEYFIKKRVSLKMNRDINNPTPQYTKLQQLYFEEIHQIKIQIEQHISINKKMEQDLQNLNQQFIDQMKENSNNDVYIDIENDFILDKKCQLSNLRKDEEEKNKLISSTEKEISLYNEEKMEIEKQIEQLHNKAFSNEAQHNELMKQYDQTEKSLELDIKTINNKLRLLKAKAESYKSIKHKYSSLFLNTV